MITKQQVAYVVHLHQEDCPSLAQGFECGFCRIKGYLNLHHMLHFSKGLFALLEKILYICG